MSTKTLTPTQANAVNAYAGFLKAGMTYGEAMKAVAKELRGTPCATFLGELAKVHAKKYQCNYTWDGKGRAVFYNGEESTRETRSNSARVSWDRNVMVWFKPETPTKPKTHARIVLPKGLEKSIVELIKAANLDKAQLTLLLANVKGSINAK